MTQGSEPEKSVRFALEQIPEAVAVALAQSQAIGAIGPSPLEQHLLHALGFADALSARLSSGARVVDLGSGGGIPGLVMASVLLDLDMTLLEGRTARCELLEDLIDDCNLAGRVHVIARRAEDAGREPRWRGQFDAVVARGFAAPAVTAECAAPLLRVDGVLCVSEPPDAEGFARWPREGCRELGLAPEQALTTPFSYRILRQVELCPERFPRRVGVPAKRPLF